MKKIPNSKNIWSLKSLTPMSIAVLGIIALVGCETTGAGSKEQTGRFLGGATGGALGAAACSGSDVGVQIACGVGGALLGGFVGGEVGASMDEVDRMKAAQTYQYAMERQPTGARSQWANPDTGNSGVVVPTETYYRGQQPCREFYHDVVIGGKTERVFGTACRQPDGTWDIVES